MTPNKFRERMATLRRAGGPVLSLSEAVDALALNKVPSLATVITFDDGFYSQGTAAAEILEEFKFPATFYVTSYYVQKGNPIFRLAIQYLFWKTAAKACRISGIPGFDSRKIDISHVARREQLQWRIIDFGERELSEQARQKFAADLAHELGIDFQELVDSRRLTLMSPSDITKLSQRGFDVELHTHRHRFPNDLESVKRELRDNRAVLEPLVGPRSHFCYPSGYWTREQLEWLESLGVRSGTTCDAGLNYAFANPLALKRFLDASPFSEVEFAAELSGFSDVLRCGMRWLGLRKNDGAKAIPR